MADPNKPTSTLFMLMSLDGKISTGDTNAMDVDKHFRKIQGIKEGRHQYYELELKTDLHSLNSGKVMAKIGINTNPDLFKGAGHVRFIILDNSHLKKSGVQTLCNNLKKLYLVTSNKNHPAFALKDTENLEIIYYEKEVNFKHLFKQFKQKYGIKKITIQSGGTLNAIFLREKLIDKISVVIAPALIGGQNTPSLVDGLSLSSPKDLPHIKALKLIKIDKLKKSYIHLKYKVINETVVEQLQ